MLQLVVFETPVGNRILAVGGDAVSSFSRGVKVTQNKIWSFCLQRPAGSVCRCLGRRFYRLRGRQLRRNDGAFCDRRRSSGRMPFGGRPNFAHWHAFGSLYAPRHPEFSHPPGRPASMVHPRRRTHRCTCELGGSHSNEIGSKELMCRFGARDSNLRSTGRESPAGNQASRRMSRHPEFVCQPGHPSFPGSLRGFSLGKVYDSVGRVAAVLPWPKSVVTRGLAICWEQPI